jgi:hypothetical protein
MMSATTTQNYHAVTVARRDCQQGVNYEATVRGPKVQDVYQGPTREWATNLAHAAIKAACGNADKPSRKTAKRAV